MIETIRAATLVDIPRIVRLLAPAQSATDVLAAGDAERSFRLVLTHVALSHGGLWVTEDAERIVAAACAMPTWALTDTDALPAILHREIGDEFGRQPVPDDVASLVGALQWDGWVLMRLGGADGLTDHGRRTLLDRAAAWTIEQARNRAQGIIALAGAVEDAKDLQELGFVTQFTPQADRLWVGQYAGLGPKEAG